MRSSDRVTIKALLAIDQASVSGVAMGKLEDGRLRSIQSGEATKHEHRAAHVLAAIQLAGGRAGDLLVVLEDHSHIPASSGVGTPQLLGMGAARGRWEECLDMRDHPESMRFRVPMQEWRGAILGPRFARARKEVVKPEAVRWAAARTGRTEIGDDEAEALCILHWAADAIPRRLAAERLQRDLFDGVQPARQYARGKR